MLSKSEIMEKLNNVECPLLWKYPEMTADIVEEKIPILLEKINSNLEIEVWKKFIINVELSVRYDMLQKSDESYLAVFTLIELLKNTDVEKDEFLKPIIMSLLHTVSAMAAKLCMDGGKMNEAEVILNEIKVVKEMNNIEKSAMQAIKSAIFYEFDSDGCKLVIENITEAVKLNPNEPEWQYIFGNILRKIRRAEDFFGIPKQEELLPFETACELKENDFNYKLAFAFCLKECSNKLFLKLKNDPKLELIKTKTIQLNEKCSNILLNVLETTDIKLIPPNKLAQIAKALTELPHPFKDIKKAKQILLQSVEIHKHNAMALHYLAIFSHRIEENFELALEYYKKSYSLEVRPGVCLNIIRVERALDPNYDPLPIMEEVKRKYKGLNFGLDIKIEEVVYYLFGKNDPERAVELAFQLIDEKPNLNNYGFLTPACLYLSKPISLYELLYHVLGTNEGKINETFRLEYKTKLEQHKPELFKTKCNPNYINELKDLSNMEENRIRQAQAHYKKRDGEYNENKLNSNRNNYYDTRLNNNDRRGASKTWRSDNNDRRDGLQNLRSVIDRRRDGSQTWRSNNNDRCDRSQSWRSDSNNRRGGSQIWRSDNNVRCDGLQTWRSNNNDRCGGSQSWRSDNNDRCGGSQSWRSDNNDIRDGSQTRSNETTNRNKSYSVENNKNNQNTKQNNKKENNKKFFFNLNNVIHSNNNKN